MRQNIKSHPIIVTITSLYVRCGNNSIVSRADVVLRVYMFIAEAGGWESGNRIIEMGETVIGAFVLGRDVCGTSGIYGAWGTERDLNPFVSTSKAWGKNRTG